MKLLKIGLLVLGAVGGIAAWAAFAVFVSLYGWWMSPIAADGDFASFAAEARQTIEESNPGNTAFVLIENGEVVSEYYGQSQNSVNGETVFPTASFSKWITAQAVMALVEEGAIDLDEPVSTYLTRWSLPESQYDAREVTVRRLLSHTAGLTDGLGFGDYEQDEDLPSLEESLKSPRASGGRKVEIAVGQQPGDAFAYSGGGFLILQLVVEEVSQRKFEDFVSDTILAPLGMQRSSFSYIGQISNASQSFDREGRVAPQYKYAAAGATGFSSTANDLTALVQAIVQNSSNYPLDATTLRKMREPQAFVSGAPIWGLGTILYAPTPGGETVFGHDGANDPAINTSVRINPETNDAYLMLVSGHPSLATDIGAEWVLWQTGYPDVLSTERALRSALVPIILGAVLILVALVLLFRWTSLFRSSGKPRLRQE